MAGPRPERARGLHCPPGELRPRARHGLWGVWVGWDGVRPGLVAKQRRRRRIDCSLSFCLLLLPTCVRSRVPFWGVSRASRLVSPSPPVLWKARRGRRGGPGACLVGMPKAGKDTCTHREGARSVMEVFQENLGHKDTPTPPTHAHAHPSYPRTDHLRVFVFLPARFASRCTRRRARHGRTKQRGGKNRSDQTRAMTTTTATTMPRRFLLLLVLAALGQAFLVPHGLTRPSLGLGLQSRRDGLQLGIVGERGRGAGDVKVGKLVGGWVAGWVGGRGLPVGGWMSWPSLCVGVSRAWRACRPVPPTKPSNPTQPTHPPTHPYSIIDDGCRQAAVGAVPVHPERQGHHLLRRVLRHPQARRHVPALLVLPQGQSIGWVGGWVGGGLMEEEAPAAALDDDDEEAPPLLFMGDMYSPSSSCLFHHNCLLPMGYPYSPTLSSFFPYLPSHHHLNTTIRTTPRPRIWRTGASATATPLSALITMGWPAPAATLRPVRLFLHPFTYPPL